MNTVEVVKTEHSDIEIFTIKTEENPYKFIC